MIHPPSAMGVAGALWLLGTHIFLWTLSPALCMALVLTGMGYMTNYIVWESKYWVGI